MNRTHMTEDAKRAAKVEKKLKVLLGGYQVRTYSVSVWFYLIRFKPYFAWCLVTKAKIIITFINAQKILELKEKKKSNSLNWSERLRIDFDWFPFWFWWVGRSMLDFFFNFRAKKSHTDIIQVTSLTELLNWSLKGDKKMNFNQFK